MSDVELYCSVGSLTTGGTLDFNSSLMRRGTLVTTGPISIPGTLMKYVSLSTRGTLDHLNSLAGIGTLSVQGSIAESGTLTLLCLTRQSRHSAHMGFDVVVGYSQPLRLARALWHTRIIGLVSLVTR
jgi:hypothetical protein